jgi:RNA polymerase sigma factor (sigma-70 family)
MRGSSRTAPGEPSADRAAVEPLDEEVETIVRRVAAARHRPGGALDLDDLIQIGRLAARSAAASHDGRRHGRSSFIAHAAGWRIQDAYRRERREPQPSPSVREFEGSVTRLHRPDFSDGAVRRLDLIRAMRRLRPEYRLVLFELQVLDRPFREVADDRGISLGALKSLHHRALEQLRDLEAEAA